MSSKSHVFCHNRIEAYHETNEQRHSFFGDFIGFDVYFIVNHELVKELIIKDMFIKIKLYKNETPITELSFFTLDASEYYSDFEYLHIVLKGGSEGAKLIESFKEQ